MGTKHYFYELQPGLPKRHRREVFCVVFLFPRTCAAVARSMYAVMTRANKFRVRYDWVCRRLVVCPGDTWFLRVYSKSHLYITASRDGSHLSAALFARQLVLSID